MWLTFMRSTFPFKIALLHSSLKTRKNGLRNKNLFLLSHLCPWDQLSDTQFTAACGVIGNREILISAICHNLRKGNFLKVFISIVKVNLLSQRNIYELVLYQRKQYIRSFRQIINTFYNRYKNIPFLLYFLATISASCRKCELWLAIISAQSKNIIILW